MQHQHQGDETLVLFDMDWPKTAKLKNSKDEFAETILLSSLTLAWTMTFRPINFPY